MSDPSLLCIQHSLRNNDSPVHSQAQEKDTLSKCMPIKEHEPAQAGGPASNPVSVGDKNHAECHKEKINQPPSIREDRNGPECDSEFCEEDETTESPTTSTSDSAARDGVYTSLFEFNRIPSAHRLSLRAHRTQGKVQRVSLLTGRTRRPLRKIQKRLSKESKPLQKDNTIMELMSLAASRNRFLDTDGDIILPSIKEFCEMNGSDKEEWQRARSLF
ncbi:hypothetical protein IWW34DRAFT_872501 [Fusarium oxysporum f. sp. albedinis]|nr:hypothetical protein IWW34DRAFT_872501 [Fusarium oxysporum f. sp. albedinis]